MCPAIQPPVYHFRTVVVSKTNVFETYMVGTHFADAEMPAKRARRRHLAPTLEETRPIEDVSKLNAFLIINIEFL